MTPRPFTAQGLSDLRRLWPSPLLYKQLKYTFGRHISTLRKKARLLGLPASRVAARRWADAIPQPAFEAWAAGVFAHFRRITQERGPQRMPGSVKPAPLFKIRSAEGWTAPGPAARITSSLSARASGAAATRASRRPFGTSSVGGRAGHS